MPEPSDMDGGLPALTVNPNLAAQGRFMRRDFGPREGGAPGMKGLGYFGRLMRPGGGVSTELSFDFDAGGQKVHAPLIVPTLTRNELEQLLRGDPPTLEMMVKAQRHALERLKQGRSPFALEGEQGGLPEYSTPNAQSSSLWVRG